MRKSDLPRSILFTLTVLALLVGAALAVPPEDYVDDPELLDLVSGEVLEGDGTGQHFANATGTITVTHEGAPYFVDWTVTTPEGTFNGPLFEVAPRVYEVRTSSEVFVYHGLD